MKKLLPSLLVPLVIGLARLPAAEGGDAKPAPAAVEPGTRLRWEAAYDAYRQAGKTTKVVRLLNNMRDHLRRQGKAESDVYLDLTFRLGTYLRDVCDFEGAKTTYVEAAALAERLHGSRSPAHLNMLVFQANLLVKEKRYAEAEAMGRDVLRQVEAALDPDHPVTGNALETLTLALLELQKYPESEANLRRVLESRRRTLGYGARATGEASVNLGTYYLEIGDTPKASVLFRQGAGMILGAINGDPFDSRRIFRNLVRLSLDTNARMRALKAADLLFDIESGIIQESFPGLPEMVRLELHALLEPTRWFATLEDPRRIAVSILQTKSVTIDQLLAKSPEDSAAVDPFAALLQPEGATQGMSACAPEPTTLQARPNPAFAPAPRLRITPSRELKKVVDFPDPITEVKWPTKSRAPLYTITPEEVCRALPKGTAVVEILRYNHYLGRFKDEPRYGALVFRSRQSVGELHAAQLAWVSLGAAEPIDREIHALENHIRDPMAAALLAAQLRTLYGLVWEPVARALPADTENVFVCPDGQTCFLPFGVLLDLEGRFLADRQFVMYLSTARDLFQLRPPAAATNRDFAVFAAPTFAQNQPAEKARETRFRDIDARSLSELQLPDLPGSRAEAELLRSLADRQHYQTSLFLGEAATKQNVRGLQQPRIVHFATHGFFLPPAGDGPPANPMDRSGLALAGAQATLQAMAEGRTVPAGENDGLLTAREVARLPLASTWIATLSACDTGRGEARSGEGVLGLRRGFLVAGAQNLLLCLWKIPDHETAAFMRDFYTRALESNDPAVALALTQRERLGRLRQERGIAAAVTTAGAFVLNASGRLPLPQAEAKQP